MAGSTYELIEHKTDDKLKFFFKSTGKSTLIKTIEYAPIGYLDTKRVYNLAFGDYDRKNDQINDSVNTENGDVYKIFNTVLTSVPLFFSFFTDSIIIVQGSDSRPDFADECKLTCRKRCLDHCKNEHRRINIYRYYVNSNFKDLSTDFAFYGGFNSITDKMNIEKYIPYKKYDAVLVMKNK